MRTSLASRGRMLGLAVVLVGSTVTTGSANPPSTVAGTPPPPNIVLILSDDQRWDTLWAMPNVQSLLASRGMTFSNFFVSNSDCCPSRASILTGNYSHATGVYTNANGPYGGVAAFDDSSTVATWLHDGGYRTALIGKYLNGYDATAGVIPPGWDRWFGYDGGGNYGGYYDYTISDQGTPVTYGSTPTDYSTDVFGVQADDFIRGTPTSQPLFLYFAPHAPHRPATPPVRYKSAFSDLAPWRPPNYNEADVSDKPAWVQAVPRIKNKRSSDRFRIKQYEAVLAVDDAVGTIVQALSDTGRLGNTMIVYASDNGMNWGEHRLVDTKFNAFEESIRVPLVIRADGLTPPGSTDSHLALNLDLGATFADFAGVVHPPTEGVSLVPLLTSSAQSWRSDFLLEHLSPQAPPFCGIRNQGYAYVAYATHEEELYDLALDPYEMQNVAADPPYAAVILQMHVRLAELCNPPPPGDDFVP